MPLLRTTTTIVVVFAALLGCTVEPATKLTGTATQQLSTPLPMVSSAEDVGAVKRRAFVNRVIDGDTIEVLLDGRRFTVRYIGIDTPETVHPSKPVEAFGFAASERNKQLVAGVEVLLETDVSDTDRYGRLLRYVWLDEQTLVNAVLVSEGLAQVATYPPDVKYTSQLLALQESARSKQVGMWATASEQESVLPSSASVMPTDVAAPYVPTQNCDSSYPTVCIPPYPPDLDCSEIPYRRFEVKGVDPHGFDQDNDGIGCER